MTTLPAATLIYGLGTRTRSSVVYLRGPSGLSFLVPKQSELATLPIGTQLSGVRLDQTVHRNVASGTLTPTAPINSTLEHGSCSIIENSDLGNGRHALSLVVAASHD